MPTHAHYAGEFGGGLKKDHWHQLAKTAAAVQLAAERALRAVAAQRSSEERASKAAATAKKAMQTARKTATADSVRRADAAAARAMKAKAVVFTHAQDVERHTKAHAAAQTRHALASALAAEAERKSVFKPRKVPVVRLNPRGVGFERVHGEDETSAVLHSETPTWHFGAQMGRIHGESEHPAHSEPIVHAAPRKESVLDMLSRTRPNYVHKPAPVVHKTYEQEIASQAKRQEDVRRRRMREDLLVKRNAQKVAYEKTATPEDSRAAQAVTLPKMTMTKKLGIVRRILGL